VNAATRVVKWLWWSGGLGAKLTRLMLLPLAGIYRAAMVLRARAFQRGLMRTYQLPLPAIAVGGLSVGGSGKTPLASWIAGYYVRQGFTPGVLLRGYGGDEPLVHQRLVPEAIVVPGADRRAGAHAARGAGAQILVLDDAFQRQDVARDLNIAVINAETCRAAPWPLPSGPWREGLNALRRADLIIVTHRVLVEEARLLAQRVSARVPRTPVAVAHLAVTEFEGMLSAQRVPAQQLAGRRVVVAAGIGDPESLAAQVRALGATVQLLAYQDHHPFPAADVRRIVGAAREADYVVVTEKDAVKLRHRWPPDVREPLVALLAVAWTMNGELIERALAAVLARDAVSSTRVPRRAP
jgi:tetraacyldisaccharide 4'-kinase